MEVTAKVLIWFEILNLSKTTLFINLHRNLRVIRSPQLSAILETILTGLICPWANRKSTVFEINSKLASDISGINSSNTWITSSFLLTPYFF
jgi:hypothetical protein